MPKSKVVSGSFAGVKDVGGSPRFKIMFQQHPAALEFLKKHFKFNHSADPKVNWALYTNSKRKVKEVFKLVDDNIGKSTFAEWDEEF